MIIKEKLYGFRHTRTKEAPDIAATLHEFRHEKSGARLYFLEREDENKTFLISFKTVPEDSSGVFHIIEHSVLCGSEKYPVKEPFVELLKSSLNTFLNAMTYSDKTVYPVASRNAKDFHNLVSVYLDAVFHPRMLTDPHVFMQEGWHYEVEDGELTESGVVLNEMLGAFSSPDELSSYHIKDMLFDGTPYKYDSGGEPSEITSLTYEKFVEAHKKFYHPSNAEIILDGDVDLDSILPLIDGVLSEYDAIECDFDIPLPSLPKETYREIEYEISPDECPEDKTRFTVGYLGARFDEKLKQIATALLFDALASSNDSPLKRRIIETGLCEDMSLSTLDSMKQATVFLDFKNVKDGRSEELYGVFEEEVRRIATEGIDRETLVATLNSLEFTTRERDFGTTPSGVIFALAMLDLSLYGGDPCDAISHEALFSELREKLATDYCEKLLSELLLDNPTRVTLKMLPSKTLAEKRAEENAKRLGAIAERLGADGLKEIEDKVAALKAAQAECDSEEALDTLPRLKLSDITPMVERIPSELTETCGVPVLYTDISTSGITYLSLLFDATDLDAEEMFCLHVLLSLFEEVPTESYSPLTLQNYIRKNLGSFSTHLTRTTDKAGVARAFVSVSASALDAKIGDVIPLLREVLLGSRFEDKTLITSLLRQMLLISEEAYKTSGHTVAINRASAYTDVEAAMGEYYSGYEYYTRLKALNRDIDKRFEELKSALYGLSARLFVSERMTISLAGKRDTGLVEDMIRALPRGTERKTMLSPITPLGIRREGILAPVQAAYSATVASLRELGEDYNSSFLVARTLISYGHLWNTVRIQGGAYGVGLIVRPMRPTATVGFYSYRDPSPSRTLDCYRASGDALRKIANDKEDLTNAIIGAVGDATSLLSTRLKAAISVQRYLRGTTYEDLTEALEEILSTDHGDLLRVADALDRVSEANGTVIVADKERLDGCKLDNILKL